MSSLKLDSVLNKIKSSQLITDSFWSLLGNVLGRGLALLAGIIVARFLGKDTYGEYGIIRTTIITIGIFSTFGLGYTATKYVAEYKNNYPEKLKSFIKYATIITLFFSGIIAFLLAVFAEQVSLHLFQVDNLGTPLRILSVLIVFNALTTTQVGVMAGFKQFKTIAKVNTIVGVLTFVFSVFLTYFFGLNGSLLALLIIQMINCIINYYCVRQETKKIIESNPENKTSIFEIIKFSLPIALQEAVYSLLSWIGSLMLIRFTTFGDYGMYNVGMQWAALILFMPGILRNVILSHLSSNKDDVKESGNILNVTIKINFFATLIPCLLVILLSRIITKSYGDSFEGLGTILILTSLATIFNGVSNVYSQAYMSYGKNWILLFFRICRDLFPLLFFLIFINYLNKERIIIMCIGNLISSILFLIVLSSFFKYKILIKQCQKD